MKIYFAGSIRGGRRDLELYGSIIGLLGKYGSVLTEHVGDKALTEAGEIELEEKYVYERDMAWLKEADIVVAEVSTPSLGVGYEIGRAEGKPTLCLYREEEGKRLSIMIKGNKHLQVERYGNLREVEDILERFFSKM